jgi:predicted nucleic acid-binding protein
MIAEIANILWKKCQRGELSEDEASIAADLLSQAGIVYLPMNTLLPKATELAIKLSHPAYDCIYLAAAMDLGCSFITADSRLLNKLRQQGFAAVKCVDLAAAEAL